MSNFEARHIIEALRQGVPSRAIGRYFSEARPGIMKKISDSMEKVLDGEGSCGMIVTGRYGEGKTHLLNTIFNQAHANNCVVSYVSLSKETPMDKLYLFYQKVIANTYLPNHEQPGFSEKLEALSPNSPVASDLLVYAAKELETDKLYYVLKSYLNTQDEEEKFSLLADLEGDFVANAQLKRIYRRLFNTPAKYNVSFSKTKHAMDYFSFMSRLFDKIGYKGWVILVDEAELTGRLGKKSRLKAYHNFGTLLKGDERLTNVFSLIVMSSSYVEDVIDGKHEFDNVEQNMPEEPGRIKDVLNAIIKAPELVPLTQDEIRQTLLRVQEFHGQAYDWTPEVSADTLFETAQAGGGYLLRTKIRAAIEFLDQLYQYGEAGHTRIDELGHETFEEEEEIPSLEGVYRDGPFGSVPKVPNARVINSIVGETEGQT